MGGKSKQAQRTKNNARPSSSGRSAELLGTFNTGVIGGTALFPTLAGVAALDTALSPDLALCIKKLNKKDPITKTKALQELNELVQNSKVDDVVAMLHNWTYFYKILTVDPDRKVRELTQVCHGTIVGACGRRVAPHLKALLPSWLAAQHDDHAPARSRAQLTLRSTFPENKLPEAISFCKTEVLTHMVDNILESNSTVSRKLDNEEERCAAATRVSCGALGGLRYLTQRLPPDHAAWLWAELQGLLNTNAFWKLAGHSAPEVRTAWYCAVGALAERFGAQWGSAHGLRALRLALQVREAGGAAHALWAALLLMLRADPEWYSRLDKTELLTKRMIETLESGGWGSARAMSEVLPRLLALLPDRALTGDFCTALFDACFTGLEKRNIISSKSERAAWIAGTGECVRVLAERTDLPTEIAPSALARWLRCVLGHSAPDVRAALVLSLEPMLCGWARIQRLELLLRGFWQSIACTVSAQLKELGAAPAVHDAKLKELLDAHSLLLVTLHEALQEKPKKQKGVTFSDDNETATEDNSDTTHSRTQVSKSELEATLLLQHQLSECVQRVCAQYVELLRGSAAAAAVPLVLRGLTPMLELMGTKEVWTAMGGALTSGSATPFALWEHGLHPWLSEERTRCEAAAHATFLLLPHLTAHQQAVVFTAIEKLEAPFADWALPHSVQCSLPYARTWLRCPEARAAILRATRAALAGDNAATDTLVACLTPHEHGEIPASDDTISEVLQLVSYVVQSGNHTNSTAVGLAARLVTLLARRAAPGTDDLLAALLTHDLNDDSTETRERDSATRTAWREGVRALPAGQQAPLVQRLVTLLRAHIHTEATDLSPARIVRSASLGAALAGCCADGGAAVTELLLDEDDDTVALTHALRLDIVAGRINCPFDDVELVRAAVSAPAQLAAASFVSLARRCVLRAALLRALCACACFPPAFSAAYIELLHRHAVVRALRDGYAFCPVHATIAATDEQLTALTADITRLAPAPLRRAALHRLAERAQARGFYWAYAAALHGAPAADTGCSQTLTGDGFFHGLQAEMRVLKSGGDSHESSLARYCAAHAVMLRSLRAAHAHLDPELTSHAPPSAPSAPSADVVVDAYYRRERSMLYDTEIHEAPWSEAVCAASVADFLTELVAHQGWDAPPHHWDFVTISLTSLLASVDKSKHHWGSVKVAMVSCAVLRLLRAVSGFVAGVPAAALRRAPAAHVAALPREWADVFAPTVAHHVHSLLMHVLGEAEHGKGATMTVSKARVIAGLCAATRRVRWAELPAASRAHCSLESIARRAASVLAVLVHHGYKYLAYYTLRALQEPIVLEDAEKLRAWSAITSGEEGDGEGEGAARPVLALDYYDAALRTLQELVDAALAHLRVGEHTCSTVPGSDAHSLALGWLLLVDALGSLAQLQRGDLAMHYAELVRERRYTELLLPVALRLLPAHVAQYATDPASNAPAPKDASDLFLAVKEFTIDEASSGAHVAALACRALFLGVAGPGAGAARGWWGAAGTREARALARLVRAYVTPHLVRTQLKAVAERRPEDLPDCEVTVHWSSGEVTCCVYVEERRVELSVALSAEHPLSLPRVSAPPAHQHSPAPATHWLAVYLAYQNGSLLNALRMWVSAVTARVEASPQCYICYCRLHPSSGRLPSVCCHQCRNKFHPHCLRKWFTSSNKSNCPLCRATF